MVHGDCCATSTSTPNLCTAVQDGNTLHCFRRRSPLPESCLGFLSRSSTSRQQQFDEGQKREVYATAKEEMVKKRAHEEKEEPEKKLERCKHECRASQQSEQQQK
ncbi:hypothetical protein BHM03_00020835 [Ensete ventricosum]|nr:hypothetical protein BHM03_00020835 [Ensete ventricosum]